MNARAFDGDRCRVLLKARGLPLGEPLFVLTRTSSTNDDALNAAKAGAAHGATFVAEEQMAGRGRRGQRWSSAPGENLTFSVVLRPRLNFEHAGPFALGVGLALKDAVQSRVNSELYIKWPNDLLAGDRKLAGILLESQIQDNSLRALVVGIGLNVHVRHLPADIEETATSLALLAARDLEREQLLCDILSALAERLRQYETGGIAALLPELRAADALDGRRVRVEQTSGIARGIDESGALLIETAGGQITRVISGSVERL
jgi:BirA family biotin operon repressor/biotin-[acetyl-CoA-carboxylase] ligase